MKGSSLWLARLLCIRESPGVVLSYSDYNFLWDSSLAQNSGWDSTPCRYSLSVLFYISTYVTYSFS